MQSITDPSVQLPPSLEALIAQIRDAQQQPPLGDPARRELAAIREVEAEYVLNTIIHTPIKIKKSFDGLVIHLVKNRAWTYSNSPVKRQLSPSPQQSSRSPKPARLMMDAHCESVFSTPCWKRPEITPSIVALGELEFRKAFLILSYKGGYVLEDVVSAEEIRRIKDLPMDQFEFEVWKSVGSKCGYIKENERAKYFVRDSGRTHLYHCHVDLNGSCTFKGPYLTTLSNFLQRALGDDNVLRVKFAEENTEQRSAGRCSFDYYAKYKELVTEGIFVGLRRYRFFVFKDGGKEEKKKDPTTSPVKCFFVRTESDASSDNPDYILSGKTIGEARSLFMNIHKLSTNLPKYMARFSLLLSKTVRLDVDLSSVNIKPVEDIYCLDINGNKVNDIKGKPRIHTDGTGFISEDLTSLCPRNVFKGKSNGDCKMEVLPDYMEFKNGELPLLIQFRLFNNGGAFKGTLLVNKKLPSRTIQVRESMIKVDPDSEPKTCSINSLEIVGTSQRPKGAYLSKILIGLLTFGGVPKEYFMNLLNNTLEESQKVLTKKHAALRVAIANGETDDYAVAQMLFSGIPLEESFVQHHLRILTKEEKKHLRIGRIPVPESYYLMGTADPTGHLKSDEVCVILDNGQVSGRVLVYTNPGLHFGDVHILKATYVKDLEDFVGNSKYGIFFPCTGARSLADEMAGSDFDGDMYFVSRNPELLERFKQSDPWIPKSSTDTTPAMRSSEISDMELEEELFKLFLSTRFQPSYAMGTAADSWMALMDRLLTLADDRNDEIKRMKANMSELINIYYDALDAPKHGGKMVVVPKELKADLYPHYMEKKEEISYNSTSILGLIYDKVKSYEGADLSESEVWKHPCFSAEVSTSCLRKWDTLYAQYRQDMSIALNNVQYKNEAAKEVFKKYREILYGAEEFDKSMRREEDIFEEALAIYEVCYNYAIAKGNASYCGFAWKVAGRALCKLYAMKQTDSERPMLIYSTPSALKELLISR